VHTTFDQLVVNSPLHPPTFRTIPEQATSENDKTVNVGSRLHHPTGGSAIGQPFRSSCAPPRGTAPPSTGGYPALAEAPHSTR